VVQDVALILLHMRTVELQTKLRGLNTSALMEVVVRSGVSERAVWRIRSGETRTASEVTKERLAEAIRSLPRRFRSKHARV
jgi:UV DNA damage repair endonuclease